MNVHCCENPKFHIIIHSRKSSCRSKRTCSQLSKKHLFNLWLLRRMCFNQCLSVAVLNTRQRFGQILPRGATHTKYGREGGSGKCALHSFDKCCNVATGRIPRFLSVLPSSYNTLLPAHFSVFSSSHLVEVFILMSVVITLSRDKILRWL